MWGCMTISTLNGGKGCKKWLRITVQFFYDKLINFSWSKTPAKERAKIMMKVADIVESRLHEFAKAESKDQGKPLWLAELIDIPRVLLNMRSFAVAIQNQVNR